MVEQVIEAYQSFKKVKEQDKIPLLDTWMQNRCNLLYFPCFKVNSNATIFNEILLD